MRQPQTRKESTFTYLFRGRIIAYGIWSNRRIVKLANSGWHCLPSQQKYVTVEREGPLVDLSTSPDRVDLTIANVS